MKWGALGAPGTGKYPGGLVLDPFAGSASTGEAAHQCGGNFLGIELDAGYHAAGARRLAALRRELPLAA